MEVAFSEARMHNDIAFNGYCHMETICLIKLIGKQVHLVNGSLAWFTECMQASYCQPLYGSTCWYHWYHGDLSPTQLNHLFHLQNKLLD